MTDPSNTRPFEDKQSLSITTQAAYNKLLEGRGKKEPTTHLEVVKFWLQLSGCKWCYNDKGYYWFNKETHVWELYTSLTEWLLRFKLSEDTPSKELKEMFPCVLKTNKDEGSLKKLPKPSGVIPFSNGVFDIKKGKFRVGAEPQDYLLSLGENFYYWDYEGEKPVEILHLIDMMSGGDEKLRELILAVCWLNIVGVQERRYDGFKNCFILWTSKDGYSGRSTLFNILDTCSGNRICHLERLEDLTDANTLSRLEETNAVYCDERESVTSARANWVSILKRMVGGHQPLEVKKLYKDKFILKGHWVVNQATNNLVFYQSKPYLATANPYSSEELEFFCSFLV